MNKQKYKAFYNNLVDFGIYKTKDKDGKLFHEARQDLIYLIRWRRNKLNELIKYVMTMNKKDIIE